MEFGTPQFWVALMQIIGINIVLSGDNAVVIALAARSLPPKQQKQAVMWGSGAAVVMRIVLTVVAVQLLTLPYLKLVGAVLLLWIGIQLLKPEHEEAGTGKEAGGMAAAVRTILIADLVMSLDNVIAVAAAAKGSYLLLIIGLLISIPLVIFGSTLLMKLMERWPIIVTIGAALLGWVAGEMAITDPLVKDWVDANAAWLHWVGPIAGAVLVVAIGKWLAARVTAEEDEKPVVDLATPADQHLAGATAAGASPLLFVADEEESSAASVDRLLALLKRYRDPPPLHVLNVQKPVHGDVSTFVDEKSLKDYHHDEGLKALTAARQKLDAAKIPYAVHIGVGDPTHVIPHYAKEIGSSQIVLGKATGTATEGFTSMLTEVARLSDAPVTIV